MQHLINRAERIRAGIRTNPFFEALIDGRADNMRWVHQLRFQSRRFTQALSLRSARSRDPRFDNIFAAHAVEEGRHPEQLEKWMKSQHIEPDASVAITTETMEVASFCTDIATWGSPTIQILILNVLSEGIALDFYRAVIDHFGTDRLAGPYWHVHKEVDEIHLAMGVEFCQVHEPRRAALEGAMDNGGELYDRMLRSWA